MAMHKLVGTGACYWLFIFLLHAMETASTDANQHIKAKQSSANNASAADQSHPEACIVSTMNSRTALNCSGVHVDKVGLGNVDRDIEVLDVSFTGLASLKGISMHNKLRTLLTLNVSHNSLQELHENTFTNFKLLEKIDMSYNELEELSDNVFVSLENLKFLDLSNNRLHTLPNVLPMTEWFDVSGNQVISLSESYSTVLYPQTVFLLGGNPFHCTCDLLWLKEFLATRMYLLKFVHHFDRKKFIPTCASPAELAGKPWDKLDEREFNCSKSAQSNSGQSNKQERNRVSPDLNVHIAEIGPTWILIKWTETVQDVSQSLEIKLHRFGRNKDTKSVILPVSAAHYRWKSLEENTPYVVCFSVNSDSLGCEEVETLKIKKESTTNVIVDFFLGVMLGYLKHLFFILLMATVACLLLWRSDKKEKKN